MDWISCCPIFTLEGRLQELFWRGVIVRWLIVLGSTHRWWRVRCRSRLGGRWRPIRRLRRAGCRARQCGSGGGVRVSPSFADEPPAAPTCPLLGALPAAADAGSACVLEPRSE